MFNFYTYKVYNSIYTNVLQYIYIYISIVTVLRFFIYIKFLLELIFPSCVEFLFQLRVCILYT